MTLTDHLKNTLEGKSVQFERGVKYPSYIVNRYLSFLSRPHCSIVRHCLNEETYSGFSDQDLFEMTKLFTPEVKYDWNMFSNYVSISKKEVDPLMDKKISFVSRVFNVSKREAVMMLGKEEFSKEVEKNL